MQVIVTQGHEKGIGLEVFFKTFVLLSKSEQSKLILVAFKDSVEETLRSLKIPFGLQEHSLQIAGSQLNVEWQTKAKHSQSFTALLKGIQLAESSGVLYTLPTSKDQFPNYPGHTEFFRSYYKKDELGMFFSSLKLKVLLLSDHIPISAISTDLTEQLISRRLENAILSLKKWSWPVSQILISGMNPHAGEHGLIGHEDTRVTRVVEQLSSKYKIHIRGPIPGDTMLLEQKSANDLLVYLFHDQGLGVFKGQQGFIGSNITLGLPFPRFSPDHGTSFAMFGKNQADYRGCAYSLKEAISLLPRIKNGQNSSHKGKST